MEILHGLANLNDDVSTQVLIKLISSQHAFNATTPLLHRFEEHCSSIDKIFKKTDRLNE